MNKTYSYFSRKFALVVGVEIISSMLLWSNKLTPDSYAMIIIGTVGAYITGNVIQKRNENKEI